MTRDAIIKLRWEAGETADLAAENERLREHISDLEYALSGAIWIDHTDHRALAAGLQLSPSESHILGLIYRAQKRGFLLGHQELADAIPPEIIHQGSKLRNPDYRAPNVISIHVYRIRRKWPDLLAAPKMGQRTRLTPDGMERVAEILDRAPA